MGCWAPFSTAPSDPRPPARPARGDRPDLRLGVLSERQATRAEGAGTWWPPLLPAESASRDSPSRALGSRRRAGGLRGDWPASRSPGAPSPALGGRPGCGGGGVGAQGDTGPSAADWGAGGPVTTRGAVGGGAGGGTRVRGAAAWGGVTEAPPPGGSPRTPSAGARGGLRACSAPPAPSPQEGESAQ